jgi:uncharacterized membrane protein
MTLLFKISLFVTASLVALIAGLFYAYTVSVNLGLGKLSDAEYLRSMQSINRAILNPWFFMSFMGSLIMLPLSTWLASRAGGYDLSFYLLLAATILYVVGVFGVTISANVPLNESLDKFNISSATLEEVNSKRIAFEIPWNKFNLIRTVANVLSLAAVLWSIIRKY